MRVAVSRAHWPPADPVPPGLSLTAARALARLRFGVAGPFFF